MIRRRYGGWHPKASPPGIRQRASHGVRPAGAKRTKWSLYIKKCEMGKKSLGLHMHFLCMAGGGEGQLSGGRAHPGSARNWADGHGPDHGSSYKTALGNHVLQLSGFLSVGQLEGLPAESRQVFLIQATGTRVTALRPNERRLWTTCLARDGASKAGPGGPPFRQMRRP